MRLKLQEDESKNRDRSEVHKILQQYEISQNPEWIKVVKGPTPVDILKMIVKAVEGYFLFFKKQNSSKVKFPVHPLHVSAFVGNFVLFKYVLARTGEINVMNINGWQALHFAVLRHILKKNRKEDFWIEGRNKEKPITSLMDKIGYKKMLPDPEIWFTKAMVEYRKQPQSLETYIEMQNCLSYEHSQIVTHILEETIEKDFKNPADKLGLTPLHLAAYRGQVDLCRKIIEAINYIHPPSNKILHAILYLKIDFSKKDSPASNMNLVSS